MSTGLECEFIWLQASGKPNGEWFYILQDWSCPVGAWDWHEYATAFGPFDSEESADEHLRRNHANPGGHMTSNNPVDPASLSSVTRDLIDSARQERFAAMGGTSRWYGREI